MIEAPDFAAYLPREVAEDTLRIIIRGSVDDGQSTLIGPLLHEMQGIGGDQSTVLQAEREHGVTIDAAYCYFATRRRYIVAGYR